MIRRADIPLILTLARIVGIAPVCVLATIDAAWAAWAGFALFALLAFTDWLDGYLARTWQVTSEIGRFLDPIADKLLIAAILIVFCATGAISGLMVACPVLILLREIFISGLREFMGPKNIIVHVTMLAKLKTAMQLVACTVILLGPAYGLLVHIVGQGLLVCATILTVGSGWDYWRQMMPHFHDDKAGRR